MCAIPLYSHSVGQGRLGDRMNSLVYFGCTAAVQREVYSAQQLVKWLVIYDEIESDTLQMIVDIIILSLTKPWERWKGLMGIDCTAYAVLLSRIE